MATGSLGSKVLFTLILDFDGGTYVAQVYSPSVDEVLPEWIRKLKLPASLGLDSKQAAGLVRAFETDKRAPAVLTDTINAWCTTVLVGERLALLNIIATVPQQI